MLQEEINKDMLKETKYVPTKIAEHKMLCPACRSEIVLEVYRHDTPVEGTVIILVANCKNCGYKCREVVPTTIRDKGVEIEIDTSLPEVLKVTLYRSPYAHIYIPDLSIEVVPGPANPGEITTVEGLLLYIAENLYPLCDTMDDPPRCYDVVSKLINSANGLYGLKIIIRDPSGLSTILRGGNGYVKVRELKEGMAFEEASFRIAMGYEKEDNKEMH